MQCGGGGEPSRTHDATLAQVGEEGLLRRIIPAYPVGAVTVVGPGDDAAVLRTGGATVVTTDSMTRGRDWLDEWSTAGDVAVKLLTQNLADVAAMGARPTAVVVSLLADPATPAQWAVDFATSLGEAATAAGVVVAGGDLSSAAPGTVVVSMTALGDLDGRAPVLRTGARAGDTVALAGSLGRSGAGLWLLRHEIGRRARDEGVLAHHRRPTTPLAAGVFAADAGAHAMIDISDGLLRDADRVARASGVRLDLDGALLAPHVEALAALIGQDEALECVLTGGEEHSLLAVFATDSPLPAPFVPLGRVSAADGSSPAGVTLDGIPQQARGWDHFGG